MARTRFSESTARASKLPKRVRSGGICVRSDHLPLANLKKSSPGFTDRSMPDMSKPQVPYFGEARETPAPAAPPVAGAWKRRAVSQASSAQSWGSWARAAPLASATAAAESSRYRRVMELSLDAVDGASLTDAAWARRKGEKPF